MSCLKMLKTLIEVFMYLASLLIPHLPYYNHLNIHQLVLGIIVYSMLFKYVINKLIKPKAYKRINLDCVSILQILDKSV